MEAEPAEAILEPPREVEAPDASREQGGSIRLVRLPPGWEGLSIKLRGDRCIIAEVPKACFSSNAFEKGAKPQVDGVSEGDEVVTLNGVAPAELLKKITTDGDPWNACSAVNPPHAVGSKTKFDSPPCVACDFIRRRKTLGFDVALPMWLRAVKREMKIVLGVKSSVDADDSDSKGVSLLNTMSLTCDSLGSDKPRLGSSLEGEPGKSSVVELKASGESVSRLEDALERLRRLAALDDKTREKQKNKKGNGKGQDKGNGKGKRPTGPNLPRTRLTDALVTGEVVEWKGKYGWIKPHEAVDHHKAGAHRGRLYVHLVDLEWWVKALTPGSFCRFHVYSDANSLGAEECTELKDDSGGGGGADVESASWDDKDAPRWSGRGKKRSRSRSPLILVPRR